MLMKMWRCRVVLIMSSEMKVTISDILRIKIDFVLMLISVQRCYIHPDKPREDFQKIKKEKNIF